MSTTARFGLLAALYFSQGLPYGFFTKGLGALLRENGLSVEHIGLASLLFLPWALKFLWAPLVDGFGRRKHWILVLQVLAAGALLAMAQLDLTAHLTGVVVLIVIINTLSATQDIATDGLAVHLLPPAERGMGNAVQVGAYRIGMIVGGGVILIAYAALGWRLAISCMAALVLIASIPIALYVEPARPPGPKRSTLDWTTAAFAFMRRPGALAWVMVLLAYKSFDALAGPMISPMMIDAGYSVGDVGMIAGTAGSMAGLAGAVLGGLAAQYLGRVRALIWMGLAQVLAVALYALPAAGIGGELLMYASIIADSLLGGAATVALFTAMMDVCRPESAATDYTFQACVVVVVVGTTSAFSGYLVKQLGYTQHFLLTAGLTGIGWLVICALLKAGTFDRLRVTDSTVPEVFT